MNNSFFLSVKSPRAVLLLNINFTSYLWPFGTQHTTALAISYNYRYYPNTSMKKRSVWVQLLHDNQDDRFQMVLTIRGYLFKCWSGLWEDCIEVSRVIAGVLEAKHGWLQSRYVDFNVEASREPLPCQYLSSIYDQMITHVLYNYTNFVQHAYVRTYVRTCTHGRLSSQISKHIIELHWPKDRRYACQQLASYTATLSMCAKPY